MSFYYTECPLKPTQAIKNIHNCSLNLCSISGIFELVCTHYYSSDVLRRNIISLTAVRGRITSHSWPRAWANLMLNPVRACRALQKPGTEKPLTTTSLPSFSTFSHTVSVHLTQKILAQNLPSSQTVTSLTSRKSPPKPRAVYTSPLFHVLTPCSSKMACTS